MKEDILEKLIEYFYEKNFTFDKSKEKSFREKIEFARKHYVKTDDFLISYYNRWCLDPESFVLPYGVWRTLFQDEWPPLFEMWITKIKMDRREKDELRKK